MIKRKRQQKHAKNQATPKSAEPAQLTFLEHIYELRRRLFWVVLAIIGASAAGFQYKDQLVDVIMAPLNGEKLVYLTPGGGFSFIFSLCLYFGVLVAIPIIVYHLYRFLQPILGVTSRRFIAVMMAISCVLAASGAAFGYFVAIPAAINFLTEFAGDAVSPNLTADSYLGFVVAYMLGLAALFQLPLLLYIFDHVKPFPPGKLLSTQRFVVVGSVVAAAIITPTPDVINQMIVAGPIIAVYQLGAVAVFTRRHAGRKHPADVTAKAELVPAVETIPEPVVEERQEKPAPVSSSRSSAQPAPARRSQSIDGFTVSTRPTASVRVPPRPAVDTSSTRPVSSRRFRSIDGLSSV